MKKKSFILAAILIVQGFVLSSCKSKDKEISGPHGVIHTGKSVEVADEVVDSHGGQVYIDKEKDPLDGFSIDLPEGAFTDSRQFKISYAPITDHSFGPDFNPITPLITISNGGSWSDSAITIDIPVNVPEGKFAMAFLYNGQTGQLEGLPLIESGTDRVVVATRNFSHSVVNISNSIALQAGGGIQGPADQLVVTVIDREKLQQGSASKFKPGLDDMPCANVGSSFAPFGFCDGQSQAMLWYYDNKRLQGGTALFKLLDNNGDNPTPAFGYDDVKAMKFSSVLQAETRKKPIPFLRVFKWVDQNLGPLRGSFLGEEITLNAFAYSILLTKEPQYIGMFPDMGPGHAMVVYKVAGNKLFVADPNYPGDTTKKISYDAATGKLGPYFGSLSTDASPAIFTSFHYFGKSALLTYNEADKYWKDVENASIGKLKFPQIFLEVIKDNGDWEPLPDNYRIPDNKNYFIYRARTPGMDTYVRVFSEEGNELKGMSSTMTFGSEGNFRVGIAVFETASNRWAGFKWINVKVDKNSGDEPKITTDWKPGTVQPPFGEMAMTIEVNGQAITYDTCRFDIREGYFQLEGPHVNIWRDRFEVSCSQFHGEGEYKVHGEWVSNTYYPIGSFYSEEGTMKITKWRDGRLEGYFSFTGKEMIGAREGSATVTVTGSFNYKVPWHE